MLKTKFYCINKENILAHELIGLKATVVNSSDKTKIGLQGKIVNETKNLIVLETKKGEKKIAKKEVFLMIAIGKEKCIINGKNLLFRPEDRIKQFWR